MSASSFNKEKEVISDFLNSLSIGTTQIPAGNRKRSNIAATP